MYVSKTFSLLNDMKNTRKIVKQTINKFVLSNSGGIKMSATAGIVIPPVLLSFAISVNYICFSTLFR